MIWACAYDGHECTEDAECCGSCVNGKCEGERDRQGQVVPSLNDGYGTSGPEALILAEGPPSSSTWAPPWIWVTLPRSDALDCAVLCFATLC